MYCYLCKSFRNSLLHIIKKNQIYKNHFFIVIVQKNIFLYFKNFCKINFCYTSITNNNNNNKGQNQTFIMYNINLLNLEDTNNV